MVINIGRGKVLIIAEAGVNHNGSIDLAYKLIDAAKECGADVIKFQTYKTENVITKDAPSPNYQLTGGKKIETQYAMLKRLELSYNDFILLKKYCDKIGLAFLSTADEIESASFLNTIQDFFKVGSAELTDLPFLKKIAKFRKPIIISTGMAYLGEVETAINILESEGISRKSIFVLHCNSEYPTPYEDVNLNAMITIKNAMKVEVGYSDHTMGIEIPVAAVALGAKIIEKHFTLDANMEGPDHKNSLNPIKFKEMVCSIRHIEKAMGGGKKQPSKSELKNIPLMRKSIVAKEKIKRGEVFTQDNITIKRPGTGLSPVLFEMLIGLTANKNYEIDDMIGLKND